MLCKALISVSVFTGLATLWLAAMELSMKHSGYVERVWMAAFFTSQSIATVIAFATPLSRRLRSLTIPGSAVIAYMGLRVLLSTRHNRDIEGYVLIIGLALLLQALLTVAALILSETREGL